MFNSFTSRSYATSLDLTCCSNASAGIAPMTLLSFSPAPDHVVNTTSAAPGASTRQYLRNTSPRTASNFERASAPTSRSRNVRAASYRSASTRSTEPRSYLCMAWIHSVTVRGVNL